MPLPRADDTDGWKLFLERQDWADITDHELCRKAVEVYHIINHYNGVYFPDHATILAAEGALNLQIMIRIRQIAFPIMRRYAEHIEDIVQNILQHLYSKKSTTSLTLRGLATDESGKPGNFRKTVANRTIDYLRKINRTRSREQSLDIDHSALEPIAEATENSVPDLDELRSYITDPDTLAVFDALRQAQTQEEAAIELGVSVRTVRRHLVDVSETILERLRREGRR